jgi:hypothetical protein
VQSRHEVAPGDRIEHGLRMSERAIRMRDITPEKVDAAELKQVKIADVLATQPNVKREAVRHFVEFGDLGVPAKDSAGRKVDHPIVVEDDDGMHLADGHHRLAAMKLLGQEQCYVYHLAG